MTIEEMVRRTLRAHVVLLVFCIAVALAVVVTLQLRQGREYDATIRLQVGTASPTSTTEADALGSRVLALATTPSFVSDSLHRAGIDGNATDIADRDVTIQRLGESSVVSLTVRQESAARARRLAVALAGQVTRFMNNGAQALFNRTLSSIESQLVRATAVRDALSAKVPFSSLIPVPRALQLQLNAAQGTVERLTAARTQLTVADSTRGLVVLVDGTRPEVVEVPSTLVPRSALAVLLGLLTGLFLAVVIETLRPRLDGPRALGRLLDAPVLARAGQGLPAQATSMSLGARRLGVSTVVLLGVDPEGDRAATRMLHQIGVLSRAPASSNGHAVRPRVPAGSPAATRRAPGPAPDDVAGRLGPPAADVGGRPHARFVSLGAASLAQDGDVGAVLVCPAAPLRRDVDQAHDVLRSTGWPVIGILDVDSDVEPTGRPS